MIRAILADDHEVVRRGIKQVLEEQGDVEIIRELSDGAQAVTSYKRLKPDVAILDISMPEMDGLEAAKQILDWDPSARILMLTMHPEEQYAIRSLRAGVKGYITKNAGAEELYKAVVSVSQGRLYVSESGRESVITQLLTKKNENSLLDNLSDRELQVLRMIASGHKTREIADSLMLSVKTVETYRGRLMAKTKLHTVADLVIFARENNLI
jgi:DNA-binding NarL/FixJ family response regulator